MRGTLIKTVGFTSARSSRSLSTFSQMAIDAPIERSMCSSPVCPNECAHGRNDSERSPFSMGTISWMALTLAARFRCVKMTPFGLPVVPLV